MIECYNNEMHGKEVIFQVFQSPNVVFLSTGQTQFQPSWQHACFLKLLKMPHTIHSQLPIGQAYWSADKLVVHPTNYTSSMLTLPESAACVVLRTKKELRWTRRRENQLL